MQDAIAACPTTTTATPTAGRVIPFRAANNATQARPLLRIRLVFDLNSLPPPRRAGRARRFPYGRRRPDHRTAPGGPGVDVFDTVASSARETVGVCEAKGGEDKGGDMERCGVEGC